VALMGSTGRFCHNSRPFKPSPKSLRRQQLEAKTPIAGEIPITPATRAKCHESRLDVHKGWG